MRAGILCKLSTTGKLTSEDPSGDSKTAIGAASIGRFIHFIELFLVTLLLTKYTLS